MKTILSRLLLTILLSIAANSNADVSGRMLECATGGYAKENRPPAYLNKQLFGANMLFFQEQDNLRANPEYKKKFIEENFGALRFPGGTDADNYHWQTGKTDNLQKYPVGHISSDNDLSFDEFMTLSKSMNAEPSIVLNYLSWFRKDQFEGAKKEADAWIRYANIEKKYGIKYWEMGNEVYFSPPTENINVKVRTYAKDYKAMKKVLRAVDNNALLGAAMPMKLHFKAKSDKQDKQIWWNAFLDEVGEDLDYIILHDYKSLSTKDYISGGTRVPEQLQEIRQLVRSKIGHTVPIHFTEWNVGHKDENPIERDSVLQGLFVAEALLDFAVNDVRLATFWPLHSNNGNGLFSNNAQQYFAAGHAFRLLAPFQGQQFLFDCNDQAIRMTRLTESQGNEKGALIVINKGVVQQIDIASVVGKNSRVSGLSTFTATDGKYSTKTYSNAEFEEFNIKTKALYPIPSRALFIFKLSKK